MFAQVDHSGSWNHNLKHREAFSYKIIVKVRFQCAVFVLYSSLRSSSKFAYVIVGLLAVTVQSFQPRSCRAWKTHGAVAKKASFSERAEFEALQYIYTGWPPGAHLLGPGHTYFPPPYLSVCLLLFITHHWMSLLPTQLCEKWLMLKFRNLMLLLTESLNHEWLTFCFSDCSLFAIVFRLGYCGYYDGILLTCYIYITML